MTNPTTSKGGCCWICGEIKRPDVLENGSLVYWLCKNEKCECHQVALVDEKKVPCDCPKGGMYEDGRVCERCDGTEWVCVGGEEETQKGWREKFRCNLAVIISGVARGDGYMEGKNVEDEVMRVFDGVLAAQETAFKERVRERLVAAKKQLQEEGTCKYDFAYDEAIAFIEEI